MIRALCIAAILALATTAHADEGEEHNEHDPLAQIPIMVLEHGLIIVPPAYYYWHTVSDQKEDWELQWDEKSWHSKLLSTNGWVLDTNRFMPNAIRHPLTGALSYQVGRANGLGPGWSTALAFATSVFWELVVEYRENPSVNDVATNTFGAVVIGEPLFQLGMLGEGPHASPLREGLSALISPFHRTQKWLGWSWLGREPTPANELLFQLAPSYARIDPTMTRAELDAGLDLSLIRDGAFGQPGQGDTVTGLAGWNRELFDIRFGQATDASGVTGIRFRSETSYRAQYSRDLDELGTGDAHMIGVGGGIDLGERRLSGEWDRLGVFELVGPVIAGYHRTRDVAIDTQVAAYADVAMVDAFVFPGAPPETSRSVLLNRGYYYATGATVAARMRVRSERWDGSLDATAHQFWSFDDHRHGGTMDPKGVADQRVIGTARLGVHPTGGDWLVGVFGEATGRRGTWSNMTRTGVELDAGLGITAGF